MTLANAKTAVHVGGDAAQDASERIGFDAIVEGAVQGVGYRPFVARVAEAHGITGMVTNTLAGVRIEAEGTRVDMRGFLDAIQTEAPKGARIAAIRTIERAPRGFGAFSIAPSEPAGTPRAQIMADLAACPECLKEVLDPNDRRYRYPFTNCTHCGPRYTILRALPYDRDTTSMAAFTMCLACREEYEDVSDRRYHAQPLACPDCGPQLSLWDRQGSVVADRDEALAEAVRALRCGGIVGVKGLGGFHLMVDAENPEAVNRLRTRKSRPHKPFAVMVPEIARVPDQCVLSPVESALLASPEAPIMLLERAARDDGWIETVAPDSPTLGVMLPYTPLHHILLQDFGGVVVATSANVTDEPICIDEREALGRLERIADCLLVHDRPILRPVDDSVVRVVNGTPMLIRRARGYAPLPIGSAGVAPGTLAVGGHQKNAVAVTRQDHVYLSQHVGDLSSPHAADLLRRTVEELPELLSIGVGRIVSDLHPDYASTVYADEWDLPQAHVQHHYAHALSCMAEHGLRGPVLAVVWDGTGYGMDGTIWGGEFLVADREDFERVAHLRPFRLPGGEKAMREPRRSALGILWELFGTDCPMGPARAAFDGGEWDVMLSMLTQNMNTPVTTSAGRLFDAVASLTDMCHRTSFEGQAPMAIEAIAQSATEACPYSLAVRESEALVVDWEPAVRAILVDIQGEVPLPQIALGIHEALARSIQALADKIAIDEVVLSGGCFQNRLLSERAVTLLETAGHRVYRHREVPPNDGGLALGQAYYLGEDTRHGDAEPCA